eukprot:SAG31_NODE_25182_length_466_cov_1.177112_1_plen_99_part_10
MKSQSQSKSQTLWLRRNLWDLDVETILCQQVEILTSILLSVCLLACCRKPRIECSHSFDGDAEVRKAQQRFGNLHYAQLLEGHKGAVWVAKFSRDGRYL